jgi:hypothetical protein
MILCGRRECGPGRNVSGLSESAWEWRFGSASPVVSTPASRPPAGVDDALLSLCTVLQQRVKRAASVGRRVGILSQRRAFSHPPPNRYHHSSIHSPIQRRGMYVCFTSPSASLRPPPPHRRALCALPFRSTTASPIDLVHPHHHPSIRPLRSRASTTAPLARDGHPNHDSSCPSPLITYDFTSTDPQLPALLRFRSTPSLVRDTR